MGYLAVLEGGLDVPLLTLIGGIAAFWMYPIALSHIGGFKVLALASLQHLTLLILFASYHYGGLSSPFFFWLLVVPLFGFFYLGDDAGLRRAVITALIINVGLYVAIDLLSGHEPERVPAAEMDTVYFLSVLGAIIYVMMMALADNRLLMRQTALVQEAAVQRAIAEQLLHAKDVAQAANRAKTEFLATTSHELRTPLNAIIGFSQLIRKETFGPMPDKYLGYVGDIEESGKHLLEIINDILDIAKAESGRFDLTEEDVDTRQVIAASLRLVHTRAAKSRITMSVRVPADLPRLRADHRRVKQMLLNLLGNAIKFTAEGGSIVVSAGVEDDGSLAVRIADTGIGIAKENLAKVTQPFFQVDNSLARRNEGVGLGLPLVSSFMQRHGGMLVLTSELGRGTSAMLCFPAARVLRRETLAAAS
jgi:signal transduction histidine kinase